MNRRQATKLRARARKEHKLMVRRMRTMKPNMKPRLRQWWKAWHYRWKAEWKKEMEKEEYIAWRAWSALYQERSAFKFDVFDAPIVIEAEGESDGQRTIVEN